MTVTLRRLRGSGLMIAARGPVGIVVHRLQDMADMGYRYLPGSRGEWVRGMSARRIVEALLPHASVRHSASHARRSGATERRASALQRPGCIGSFQLTELNSRRPRFARHRVAGNPPFSSPGIERPQLKWPAAAQHDTRLVAAHCGSSEATIGLL